MKTGDKVVYSKDVGIEINLDGEDFLMLTESDILLVIE